MDSEDSSGNESGRESTRSGPRSARSVGPRSPPASGPDSPPSDFQSGRNTADSRRSRSRSSSSERSRPQTPKSLNSENVRSNVASPNSTKSNGPRSPSPANSSRSTSSEEEDRKDEEGSIAERNSVSSRSSSKKSKSASIGGRFSRNSRASSISSRGSRRSRRKSEDGNSSDDSSDSSVDSSSRKNKNIGKPTSDTQPEEISDGDMESEDNEKEVVVTQKQPAKEEINISHEDLSDVSDLDESIGGQSYDSKNDDDKDGEIRENGDNNKIGGYTDAKKVTSSDKNRADDGGEEQLDFEAEDGECGEIEPTKESANNKTSTTSATVEKEDGEEDADEKAPKEELEEGEVTDEDDVRPEETEPRPVCRFFSRGQCTWGASCRFLHPGVTDKGNYTMFEMIRPVVPGEYGRGDERLYGKPEPPAIESAWERGLRTAKEMLRKSVKRKEQDIDFEEKKLNLSLAQEEFDKENGYYGRGVSPEPRYVRHIPAEYPARPQPPEEYYGRRQVVYETEYAVAPPRERVRYRELPSHRMPDYYNNKYDEESSTSKRPRPKREVIVQRVEERQPAAASAATSGRADEWSDPWMRSKSPAGRRKETTRKRSYSSGSSYSSSSSSHSSSESTRSSYRSRSRSSHGRRRRRRSRSRRSRHVSPSVIVSEKRAANERAALMNPPAPKRRAPSPGMMRVGGANPPAPSKEDQFGRNRSKLAVAAAALARAKNRRKSSRSSSESSGSSSDSSDSSSTSSSSREASPVAATKRAAAAAGVDLSLVKAMDALKGNSSSSEKRQIKLNLKNPMGARKELADLARKAEAGQSKKRGANSPPSGADQKSKKATSRREELLKQLKAVEDAIAKKRSKVN